MQAKNAWLVAYAGDDGASPALEIKSGELLGIRVRSERQGQVSSGSALIFVYLRAMLKNNTQEELERIILRFLNGQAPEYQIICNRIKQYICCQRKLERSTNEDLVADVTLALIESLRNNRFKGDSLRALNVFIFNTIRNKLSHLARHPYSSVDDTDYVDNCEERSRLHDEVIADQLLAARIYVSLDVPCRQLLWMRYHLQWTDQEIADHLDKSKNAVSTAVCRCLHKARSLNLLDDIQ